MFYPEEIIEEVRRKNDIADVIGSYIKLNRRGSNYQGLCPFHNEKTPSFSVNPARQIYKCFGCGKAGNVITFIMEYESMSFPEALKLLADRSGVELPEAEFSEEKQNYARRKKNLMDIYKKTAVFYHKTLRTAEGSVGYEYLKNRNLSDEIILRFGLGYSKKSGSELYEMLRQEGYDSEILKASGIFGYSERNGAYDKFWNRVMFPIMDINNRVIAFGGRVMGDGEPKYLNSAETEIFDKSRNLYAMNIARKSRAGYLLLCEGYMDVIALHQAGFDNAVASLGTALTGLQARLMSRYSQRVIISYDSDGAGTKAALRAIPILRAAGISAKVLRLTPYKDPDEFIKALGKEEFEKRIEGATPGFEFELECMEKSYDLLSADEKNMLLKQLAGKMLDYPDELERNTYMAVIAKRYDVTLESFRQRVNRLALGIDNKNNDNDNYINREVKKENKSSVYDKDRMECESLVLTWAVENEKYLEILGEYLCEDDFQEGVPGEVAKEVYKRKREKREINPAAVVNRFVTPEEQTVASDLFQTDLWLQMSDDKMLDKAFADAVTRLKEISVRRNMQKASEESDGKLLVRTMEDKKKLGRLSDIIQRRLKEH